MAKKKDKNQPITHIQNLNLEIDYDKLAESIVKAQGKANETIKKHKPLGISSGTIHSNPQPRMLTFPGTRDVL